jgi:hypothetical protein
MPDDSADDRRGKRPVGRWLTTVLACLLVLFALIAPNQVGRLTPGAFVQIPLEGLLAVALVVVVPARARRLVAAVVSASLGLLAILKIVDMAFYAVLDRPVDPSLDWLLIDDAVGFLTDSVGRPGAAGLVIAVTAFVTALLVLMTLSVLHLTRLVAGHTAIATRVVAALGVVWIACSALGLQVVPDVPVASGSAAALVHDHALQVRADLRDRNAFAAELAADAFRDAPGEDLLTGLRGKDVILVFVESYGRDAVEDPEFAPQIGAVLAAGDRRLRAAGYASRSGFLTSPTVGGGSWLAHATLLSGVWIDNEQRHRDLLASDRLTLNTAFRRADWRTVGVMPGVTRDWPEGRYYGYDRFYDARNLGYAGPKLGYVGIPDQYTLSAFEHLERASPHRTRLMAEIVLVSSHSPWTAIPQVVDWERVGDGSALTDAADATGASPDASRVRTGYRRSIEYALSTLISYVETYGDDDLVLVVLGDHQPAPIITGAGASRDVPITIVARDREVLRRISGWGWQDGLKPGPQAPVWRMDMFRDRFLTAFGS